MMTCPKDTLEECKKCIQCGICEKKCPIHFSTSSIVTLYKHQKYNVVHEFIYSNHPFPIICGYICPNHFCMNNCPKHVDIKELHRHLAVSYNWEDDDNIEKNGKKIAIVGGGVSGLTAAWYLHKQGYTIDLYEKSDTLGGELNLIPEKRLPKDKLDMEITRLSKYIDNLYLNTEFNSTILPEYDNIIYCIGSKPRKLPIYNQNNTIPIIYYDEYLSNDSKKENIGIIGGGNVALDCALYNKGTSTIFVRRNYWDMRINENDFKLLRDKKISIIDNFIPSEIKNNTLIGQFYNNVINFNFDRIIVAIGKESKVLENLSDKEIQILPEKSVIETIATTLDQLRHLTVQDD